MKNISIRSALSTGWAQFTRRPWYLFGLSLAVFLFFVLTASGDAVVTALSYIVYGAFISVLLKHYHGGQIVFDDLFDIDKRWIYFAFLALIKALLILLGFAFFVLPGIYLAIRWMFAELLVIDKGMRPMEALRASSQLTQGHWWKLFFFSLISILLMSLGLVVFIVGAVAVVTIMQFATIKMYYDLQTPEAPPTPETV